MGDDSMLERTILSPIVSQYDWNLYRVPLRRQENKYVIFVDNFFTRVFDEHSLPDEIKTKMAMILASPQRILQDHEATMLSLMTAPDENVREIGWRVSDSYFCLILSHETLCELRGGVVRKEDYDT